MIENKQLMVDLIAQRQLTHCPPHFELVSFDSATSDKIITNWIWENLTGRFYFGDYYEAPNSKSLTLRKAAGFELHSEASYFAMFLPELNKFR